MITQYIQAAMKRAVYEKLSDGSYCGEIPGFQGVYASAGTLEDCREMLQEVLEGWLVLGHQMSHKDFAPMPA
jgi:predicted RNase H-like HicB family nuclease